jgi:hypothetical protein
MTLIDSTTKLPLSAGQIVKTFRGEEVTLLSWQAPDRTICTSCNGTGKDWLYLRDSGDSASCEHCEGYGWHGSASTGRVTCSRNGVEFSVYPSVINANFIF